MKAKKNENLRLERNSGLYFAIGLTLVLALVYLALEWKTFYQNHGYDPIAAEVGLIEEPPPPTIQNLPPPPPPKIEHIPEIAIVDDTSKEVETLIQTQETDPEDEIFDLKNIQFEKPPIDDEIIFVLVEDKPVFPGCEGADDQTACFQKMLQKHISKVFRYPDMAVELGLEGRVNVAFTIQKDGTIGNIQFKGPHKVLEEEAVRIIAKLPQMTPGKQRGTPVKVPFSIPINFQLQ